MKKILIPIVMALCLTTVFSPAAMAAEQAGAAATVRVCYPTSITRSEDGTELRKNYDLGPEDDPAGIPALILSRMVFTIP